MKPQLLKEVSESDLHTFLKSDDYAMSQKIDGVRLMLQRTETTVIGWGRSGGMLAVPPSIKSAFIKVRSNWTFDGELVGDTYHVFDIVEFPGGSISNFSWQQRQNLCNQLLTDFSDHVRLVPQKYGQEEKTKYFEKCREVGAEGVVFSNVNGRYRFGMRSPLSLKYKFVKTIDCVVIGKEINGKDNLSLGLYDNGDLVDVGKVSALTGHGKHHTFEIGDVVTVTYLYGTNARRLYQPVKPMLRNDKGAKECLMNQMIIKTDTVL